MGKIHVLLAVWIASSISLHPLFAATASARSTSGEKQTLLSLSEIMTAAAFDTPTVAAKALEAKATGKRKTAILLDQISLSGSINNTTSSSSSRIDGLPPTPMKSHTESRSIGVHLSLSLQTWLQAKGVKLNQKMMESALLALRMQMATDAAEAFLRMRNSDSRILHMGLFLRALQDIQTKSRTGQILLNPVVAAQLTAKISEIQTSLGSLRMQKEVAAADVETFLNRDFVEPQEAIEAATANGYRWEGLPWKQIDKLFPVPTSPEEAFALAAKSPALIQAQLAEDSARNQWHLTAAGVTPRLTLSFQRTSTITSMGTMGPSQSMNGDQVSVGLAIGISGGFAHRLSADRILQEVAELSHEATERRIRAGFKKMYPVLTQTRIQLQMIEETLSAILPSIENADPQTDKDVSEYIQLISTVDMTLAQLAEQFKTYLMTRIQVHGAIGTLLEEIAKLKQLEQQP